MTAFVFAHGAGGHRDHPSVLSLAEIVSGLGIEVVRFDFPYRERGGARPDPTQTLKARMREEIERVQGRPLLIGGRSMGGRVATLLAAEGLACDGLILFAYPLHPAGEPQKRRDAHLPRIRVPVLCFNGTRDALCRRDLMEHVLGQVTAPWTMHWLEGADHSFHVRKSSGRTDAEVLLEVRAAIAKWMRSFRFGAAASPPPGPLPP